jgi:hypothetical protein
MSYGHFEMANELGYQWLIAELNESSSRIMIFIENGAEAVEPIEGWP